MIYCVSALLGSNIYNVKDSGLERSFIRELVNLKEYRL